MRIFLAMTPEQEIIFDGTRFGYLYDSPTTWLDAQLNCISWGGNLATIKSAVEDSLLFYSITDITSSFSCHIGLNDIEYEAGTNGSAFVWVDGSTSSYRNFGTLSETFPIARDNYDCVRYRYRTFGSQLSHGWLNIPCNNERNCYFCSKPGNY